MTKTLSIKFPHRTPATPPAALLQQTLAEAVALHRQGQTHQALALYRQVLAMQPRHFDALHLSGVVCAQTGQYAEAVELIGRALKINDASAEAYFNHGNALQELKQHQAAVKSLEKAIRLKPDFAEAHRKRGNSLLELKRFDHALLSYQRAIALNPNVADSHNKLGNVLQILKRHDEALACYAKALGLRPDFAEALNNRGLVLLELRQNEAALESFDQALELKPDYPEAFYNRGLALAALQKSEAAVESYRRAIACKADFAEAYNNCGLTLQFLKRYEEALDYYGRALELKPDFVEALYNSGMARHALKHYQAAVECYDRAIALKTDRDFMLGHRLFAKMQMCDWRNFQRELGALETGIEKGRKIATPLVALGMTGSLELQKTAAKTWLADQCPPNDSLPAIGGYPGHDRIKIGYFSADFRNHAVAFLTAELFEKHDRTKFEITAFSFGPDIRDEMRSRLEAGFDHFIDVRELSDREAALLARDLEIDIAVDLGGYTRECRTGIFAFRAAPIQLSYIGYLGTMAAPYMDYLIADPTLIPEVSLRHYSERIVYLPSYQANDSQRRIAERVFTREELDLPETGFVFCCFNNNYKFTPAIFASWMRILTAVEGGVLLLYAENPWVEANLKAEASRLGVDVARLVFTGQLPVPEYLARFRAADLFLDTLPYNAGTTASDALWAGLPVLTCMGEAFASRMAASLLMALDLPELVTLSTPEFESVAIDLANHPEKMAGIRKKLAENREQGLLFNIDAFTRHLEAAYSHMYSRQQAGLELDHIHIHSG